MAPGSLAATVRQTAQLTGTPILITEHGTDLSTERGAEHIRRSLELLSDAIEDGVDVRGYIHWCLADNWEWIHGHHGQFGLFEVDRATQVRAPRPSAAAFGEIARADDVQWAAGSTSGRHRFCGAPDGPKDPAGAPVRTPRSRRGRDHPNGRVPASRGMSAGGQACAAGGA